MDTLSKSSVDGMESPLDSQVSLSLVNGDEAASFNEKTTEDSGNSSSGDTPESCDDTPTWDIEYRFSDGSDNRVVQLSEPTHGAQDELEFEYIIETYILPSLFNDGASVFALVESEEENKENKEPR